MIPFLRLASSNKWQSRADFPTFDKWYRKTHKKVYPITVTGMPAEEEAEIQSEAAKVSEESTVHDPVRHPFKYPADRVANISKKISISIKFPDGMKIVKTGISFTELKHLIERFIVSMANRTVVVCFMIGIPIRMPHSMI